jgi:hypothetical protein
VTISQQDLPLDAPSLRILVTRAEADQFAPIADDQADLSGRQLRTSFGRSRQHLHFPKSVIPQAKS